MPKIFPDWTSFIVESKKTARWTPDRIVDYNITVLSPLNISLPILNLNCWCWKQVAGAHCSSKHRSPQHFWGWKVLTKKRRHQPSVSSVPSLPMVQLVPESHVSSYDRDLFQLTIKLFVHSVPSLPNPRHIIHWPNCLFISIPFLPNLSQSPISTYGRDSSQLTHTLIC